MTFRGGFQLSTTEHSDIELWLLEGIFHYRGIRLYNVHNVYWYWGIMTLCGHSSHKGLLVDGRGVFGVNQSHKCLILHLPAPIGDYGHSKTQSDLVQ